MTQVADQRMTTPTAFRQHPAGADAWLGELRKAGAERFAAVGFPHPKDEEWRFTPLGLITKTKFTPAHGDERSPGVGDAIEQFGFGAEAGIELVFVDGRYAPHLSRLGKPTRGVRVSSIAEAVDDPILRQHLGKHARIEADPFVAMNAGSLRDGALIHVARGAAAEQPIHLLFLSTASSEPTVSHPRILAVLEEGARATLVESYGGAGAGAYFANPVTEIVVGQDAMLDHCKLQQESREAFHVAAMQVSLARGATFVSHSATTGGRITRNDLNVILAGERADATLNGLVIVGGAQHVDNHTMLDHAAPNCPSHELYKHVLDGKSSGVFKGKILVRQPAQKTDSKQTSKTLLLSDDAVMNSQPALEIYADDVKCTHGSTIGPVDEEQVFYLRSRGVGLDAARHLLTYAFAADITRRIKVEPVRRRLETFMAAQHGLPQDLRITDLGAHDEAARNA